MHLQLALSIAKTLLFRHNQASYNKDNAYHALAPRWTNNLGALLSGAMYSDVGVLVHGKTRLMHSLSKKDDKYENDFALHLDEFYGTYQTDHFTFNLGRKKIFSNVAYFDNVFNLAARRENYALSYFARKAESSGQDSFSVNYLNQHLSLDFVYIPRQQIADKKLFSNSDYSDHIKNTVLIKTGLNFDDLGLNLDLMYGSLYQNSSYNDLLSASINYTVNDDAILYSELSYDKNKSAFKSILGLNYTFAHTLI